MRLLVVGAGGHAKVVIDAARLAGFDVVAAIGRDGGAEQLLGVPVLADASDIPFDVFIAAIGDNAARAEVFDAYLAQGLSPATVVHPSAVIAETVTLGAGTFVAAGVIVNVDARIGENVILNTGCTVDHDCIVGDHALIGPTASLCGGVRIGSGTLLGAGVSVVPLAVIGSDAIVGAGAAVIGDVPDGMVFAGVPARPVRPSGA